MLLPCGIPPKALDEEVEQEEEEEESEGKE